MAHAMAEATARAITKAITKATTRLALCLPKCVRDSRHFSSVWGIGRVVFCAKLFVSHLLVVTHLLVVSDALAQSDAALPAQQQTTPSINAQDNDYMDLSVLVSGLPASWGLSAAPDKTLFVTHRAGSLSRYSRDGDLLATYELGLDDLHFEGQGGLSGIAFHPQYKQSPWIYLSYAYGNSKANGLKVIRILLSHPSKLDASILETQIIFKQRDVRDTSVHYGARLAFMLDNTLLITTGDAFDYREHAQKLDSQLGKIIRVTDTGDIPPNNPFADAKNESQRYIYSYGHRNPQGLIVLPNGQIISHEHGPDGGDEINMIEAGLNYGWPVITRGKDYIGSQITPFTEYPNMQQPTFNWTPSIAPSGMIFYPNVGVAPLGNRLLLTSLKYQQLHALELRGNRVENDKVYFAKSGYRMRDITLSSDGRLFILSDGPQASILEVVMTQ